MFFLAGAFAFAPTALAQVAPLQGQYFFVGLPVGFYRLSILAGDAVKFFVDIKMRGDKARIDFDLSPSAGKKIRIYVWVPGRTGSDLSGRWVEAGAGISRISC